MYNYWQVLYHKLQQTCNSLKSSSTSNEEKDDQRKELTDRASNCEATLAAVRERCTKDGQELEQLTREHQKLQKSNCTAELKDCANQKSYLEFLKKGYDAVVQQLETEAKDAKQDKEKCVDNAKEAIQGQFSKWPPECA